MTAGVLRSAQDDSTVGFFAALRITYVMRQSI